jgi:cold shock CspA family protein
MATSSVSTSAVLSSDRFTGRVKWFNNKAGYGFITVTDGPKSGSDIFVHHSSIKVDAQQYKYLVQGEYIEFSLSSASNSDHEFQAVDVSGIKGGKLMCETRHESRATRTTHKAQHSAPAPTQVQTPSPSQKPADDIPWTPVKKPRQQEVPSERGAGRGAGRGTGRGAGRGAGRGSSAGRGKGSKPVA